MAIAKEYTSVEDIKLDGEDAMGKKATLCIQKNSIYDDADGKYLVASTLPLSSFIYIYFNKNQKELIKKIHPYGDNYCTKVTIKIFDYSRPSGRLISVE